jgi:GTPase SAR1 family protein
MERLLETSIIKGFVLSYSHAEKGPELIYTFPNYSKKEAKTKGNDDINQKNKVSLTQQEFMKITIKNLSLVLTDEIVSSTTEEKPQYFCIIPFPDFYLTAITYYHYIRGNVAAFSVLVHENNRNFLYNNHRRIKEIIIEFFKKFDEKISHIFIPQEEAIPYFENLLIELKELEAQKLGPAMGERKMKIILAGLDDSGKTSFLLTVDRKFSKLMNIKPTAGAKVQSIQALGARFFVWDLGGQRRYIEKYLTKSNIYLYESDLLFYFIDIQNRERFKESLDYLKNIYTILSEDLNQDTPMVYIFSKADIDIIETSKIQKNIKYLTSEIKKITNRNKLNSFTTSIFEITSVLQAFSEGIKCLSFNRELINYNLKRFSKKIGSYITLLLNNEGLILSNYYSTQVKPRKVIKNAFEISAPQFTMLYKIFYKFKALNKEQAVFEVSNSIILIKRTTIFGQNIFILFVLNNLKNQEKINTLLPEFLDRIKSLLSRYI